MPEPISSSEFYKQSAQFCQYSYRVTKFFIVQKLICIGIFKSLPVFPKLDVKDQVCYYYYYSIRRSFSVHPLGNPELEKFNEFSAPNSDFKIRTRIFVHFLSNSEAESSQT